MCKVPVLSLTVCAILCLFSLTPVQARLNLDLKSLHAFEGFVAASDHDDVSRYVEEFLDHPESTEEILARCILYFPLIEKELSTYNLPEELKVLPLIESRFNPMAISRVGAAGLWQFMVPTARQMGLTINTVLDERRDPVKATRAALSYLQYLYGKYGDWSLAFAAYNAGPGRVNRAIKLAGGACDFAAIKPYLPRQTREYIPKYLAAQYIIEHYADYGMEPEHPDLDLQWVSTVTLHEELSLEDIGASVQLETEKLLMLNPSLKKGYVPSLTPGYELVLPERVLPQFTYFLQHKKPLQRSLMYRTVRVKVEERTPLFHLAESFRVDPFLLKNWNNLSGGMVPGGSVIIFHELYDPTVPPSKPVVRNAASVPLLKSLPARLTAHKAFLPVVIEQDLKEQEEFNWIMHQQSFSQPDYVFNR